MHTADPSIRRRGYFPQGGGHVELEVTPLQPGERLQPICLTDPGRPARVHAMVSGVVTAGGAVERLLVGRLQGPCFLESA